MAGKSSPYNSSWRRYWKTAWKFSHLLSLAWSTSLSSKNIPAKVLDQMAPFMTKVGLDTCDPDECRIRHKQGFGESISDEVGSTRQFRFAYRWFYFSEMVLLNIVGDMIEAAESVILIILIVLKLSDRFRHHLPRRTWARTATRSDY